MITLPDCLYCRHSRLLASRACDAFPKGIPDAILIEGRNHREPSPGDHGILFDPKPDAPSTRLAEPLKKAS